MIEVALFAVVALIAAYLLAPVFRGASAPTGDAHAAAEAAREACLRALHDLELDWATGKLSDADYTAQRAALEAEAAAIFRQMPPLPPR
jgi:membrane protein implicated in regulation of membrane protease activity